MRSISDTIKKVAPSATMAMNNRAKEMIRSNIDVISMAVGEPDFPTPPHIIQGAIDALNRGETHYSPSRGIPELIDSIVDKFKSDNGIQTSSGQIMVTAGAKDAIRITMMSLLNKNDEVVIIDPSWVSYEPCVQIAGGEAVHHLLNQNFQVDESIYDVITDKTKMIIVNTPSNPTGTILDRSSLRLIADICDDYDLFCLSDEIYEKLVYEKDHISIATIGDMADKTITVNGFSKAYAMTGWRLGYLSAPRDVIPYMDKVMQHSVGCVNTFAMWGGVVALTGDQACVNDMHDQFEKRRKYIMDRLTKMGLKYAPMEGAFYSFVNIGGDDISVANQWLEKAHVATTPGSAFGSPGWIRMSYATSINRIEEALNRIEELI
ncbi:MAG TPA: pyridoxal phosphate-dependent aminotransferase [Methanocorpusculum sp.]|nr:pyridoxal phosphate-dependent aminotransferase [Methanocorpusculum sp.]